MRSNIAKLCEEKGISRYRLAKNLGITDEILYRYEKKGLDKAQFGYMVKIAKELGCPLEELYEK